MGKATTKVSFFARYRAPLYVLGSQVMAAALHALAKLVEMGSSVPERVHPFTVLQIRLAVTVLGCTTYLWWTKSPEFPMGPREARPLLVIRAIGGVFGACGFYGMYILFININSLY